MPGRTDPQAESCAKGRPYGVSFSETPLDIRLQSSYNTILGDYLPVDKGSIVLLGQLALFVVLIVTMVLADSYP